MCKQVSPVCTKHDGTNSLRFNKLVVSPPLDNIINSLVYKHKPNCGTVALNGPYGPQKIYGPFSTVALNGPYGPQKI